MKYIKMLPFPKSSADFSLVDLVREIIKYSRAFEALVLAALESLEIPPKDPEYHWDRRENLQENQEGENHEE